MAAACRRFGISRPTGYKWLTRYEESGLSGLLDRSRAPWQHPNETAPEVVEVILDARRRHPRWGPRKLLGWLGPRHPGVALPAASTVATLLKKHGLVAPRRRRRTARPTGQGVVHPDAPNAVWATDFKGEFKTRDGRYCYPLTIQDTFSRFLLRCQGLRTCSTELARPVFLAAFREFGMPCGILSDNGSPFASASFSGLTRLSAWWVRLGIEVLRIEPGHPEQNGRLERVHRTLKEETACPPSRDIRAQQRSFNRFRDEFNEDRPHEALDDRTPSTAYNRSGREVPVKEPAPSYDGHFEVRRLNRNGEVSFNRHRFTVSKSICGEDIAFEPIGDGEWRVHYYSLKLGVFNERKSTVARPGYIARTARP